MRVRMKINITGARDGKPWPPPGEILEVPDHEGEELISQGYAARAEGEPYAEPQQTTTGDADPPAGKDGDKTAAGDGGPRAGSGSGSAGTPAPTRGRRATKTPPAPEPSTPPESARDDE